MNINNIDDKGSNSIVTDEEHKKSRASEPAIQEANDVDLMNILHQNIDLDDDDDEVARVGPVIALGNLDHDGPNALQNSNTELINIVRKTPSLPILIDQQGSGQQTSNNRIDLGPVHGGLLHSASQKEESMRTVDLALLSAPASSQSFSNSNVS